MTDAWNQSRAISYWLEPVVGFGVGLAWAAPCFPEPAEHRDRDVLEDFLSLAGTAHSAYAARLLARFPWLLDSQEAQLGIKRILRWVGFSGGEPAENWTRIMADSSHRGEPDRAFHFLRVGYPRMLPLAYRISDVLRECAIPHALNGSAALAMHAPFRVSADLDFTSPTGGSGHQIAAALQTRGLLPRLVKPSYVGASDPETGISIDIELGGAYRKKITHEDFQQHVVDVVGLPVMAPCWILGKKRERGTFKDQVDLIASARMGLK